MRNRQLGAKLAAALLPALLLLSPTVVDSFSVAPTTIGSRNTRLFYSNTADADIGDRVRQLLETPSTQEIKDLTTKEKKGLDNFYEVDTVADYHKMVADHDKLMVVRFAAPWCLACKAVAPLFDRLAREYPHVDFVQVEVSKDNREDIQGLGVPSLPYGYIFHPEEGLVEALNMNKRHFNDFHKVLESYDEQECQLPELDQEQGTYESPFARVQ